MHRTLIQIAAELAKLPDEQTPDAVFAGCKRLAVELRDIHDADACKHEQHYQVQWGQAQWCQVCGAWR